MRESDERFKGKQQILKTKINVMNNASPGRKKPKQGNGTNTEKCNSTKVPKIKKKKKRNCLVKGYIVQYYPQILTENNDN